MIEKNNYNFALNEEFDYLDELQEEIDLRNLGVNLSAECLQMLQADINKQFSNETNAELPNE